MQATSPTYRATADTGWLTTTSLVLIVIFAAITVIAILYGMRLAARRRAASRIENERVQADAVAVAPPVAAQRGAVEPAPEVQARPTLVEDAAAPTPPPVAPSPPPLDPGPAPGTPAADPFPAAPDLADEPIAAAAPFDAAPATEAESAPAEPGGPAAADRPVTMLKGLGPKVAARLAEHGIETVGALAALAPAQAEALDARLGPFTGRMARDRWLEQSRLLAAGEDKAFEAEFGRL